MSVLRVVVGAVLLAAGGVGVGAQQVVVPLYAGVAPGSEGKTAGEVVRVTPAGEHVYSSIHRPSLAVYLPAAGVAASGVGVLVIPGGGHREIWADHEGFRVAEWLSAHGIAAFVLKYRLAKEAGSTYTVEGTELGDARRAMRVIRNHAGEWRVDAGKVGVMGFSAGGELAAMLATRPEMGGAAAGGAAADAVGRESSRPAFAALVYPSIPAEMPLSKATPPMFLACGADDVPRVAEGVPALYLRMRRAGVPVEMHVFVGVGHGFGIRATNAANVQDWPELFARWLRSSGFLAK